MDIDEKILQMKSKIIDLRLARDQEKTVNFKRFLVGLIGIFALYKIVDVSQIFTEISTIIVRWPLAEKLVFIFGSVSISLLIYWVVVRIFWHYQSSRFSDFQFAIDSYMILVYDLFTQRAIGELRKELDKKNMSQKERKETLIALGQCLREHKKMEQYVLRKGHDLDRETQNILAKL